jgi:hypothetical protein
VLAQRAASHSPQQTLHTVMGSSVPLIFGSHIFT